MDPARANGRGITSEEAIIIALRREAGKSRTRYYDATTLANVPVHRKFLRIKGTYGCLCRISAQVGRLWLGATLCMSTMQASLTRAIRCALRSGAHGQFIGSALVYESRDGYMPKRKLTAG
jgi:hypothetical protein